MMPGINERNVETLILLGLLIVTDTAARDKDYSGPDVSIPNFEDGFHREMRNHFQKVRQVVRNDLMHANKGSIDIEEDGTITWRKQKKDMSLTKHELLQAYIGGIIGSSEIVRGPITQDDGRIQYTLGISTFGKSTKDG